MIFQGIKADVNSIKKFRRCSHHLFSDTGIFAFRNTAQKKINKINYNARNKTNEKVRINITIHILNSEGASKTWKLHYQVLLKNYIFQPLSNISFIKVTLLFGGVVRDTFAQYDTGEI